MPPRGVLTPVALAALLSAGCDSEAYSPEPTTDLAAVELAIAGAQAITAGENHSCAIEPNATVVCWGRNKSDSWAMD